MEIDFSRINNLQYRMILEDLRIERDAQARGDRAGVSRLYRHDTTCSGFMNADPNDQLQYAYENGLLPEP